MNERLKRAGIVAAFLVVMVAGTAVPAQEGYAGTSIVKSVEEEQAEISSGKVRTLTVLKKAMLSEGKEAIAGKAAAGKGQSAENGTVAEKKNQNESVAVESTELQSEVAQEPGTAGEDVLKSGTPEENTETVLPGYQASSSQTAVFEDGQEGVYNYCPSVMVSNGSTGVFYCSNTDSYSVRDSIYYTDCREINGSWYYSGKKRVLTSTSGSWDSQHVCDPSVIKGNFIYGGVQYQYLMAYLGCSSTDNQRNSIGLAFSNSLDSGWVKADSLNPIIRYSYDENHAGSFQWGAGQPSLVSLDNNGKVALFYTEGTWNLTSEKVQVWDFINMDSPTLLYSGSVSNVGTVNQNGSQDFISNADFAWSGNTLYMVCDTHPFGGSVLDCVPTVSRVYAATISKEAVEAGGMESVTWSLVGEVSSSVTGRDKNHNCGVSRDSYSNTAGGLAVFYTGASELGNFADSLWSYRIYKMNLD